MFTSPEKRKHLKRMRRLNKIDKIKAYPESKPPKLGFFASFEQAWQEQRGERLDIEAKVKEKARRLTLKAFGVFKVVVYVYHILMTLIQWQWWLLDMSIGYILKKIDDYETKHK